ncbi:transcription termination factor nusG [Aureococcus anophagefferens]|nr:transcription termination factor nusG [Aureococcus anophagefferens]
MAGGMLARRRLRSSLLALAALLVPVAAFVPSLPARARPPSRAVPVDVETSEDYEWYILQCYVGNEVWCAATIEEILGKPEHVEQRSRVETILVPTEKVASTRGRKVYHKEKIIYPGYVFCRLRMEQELWRVLTRVPKIANFVGIDAGMRNGIGEIVEGYKGAVTPVPLSAREAQMMLSVHLEGQEVGEDNIVDRFALGDVVAVLDGPSAGERGLVRSVKNDQLIVRLTGVGTASFDVPLDPDMVRHLTASELAQMEQAKEMEARAEARARAKPAAAAAAAAAIRSRTSRRHAAFDALFDDEPEPAGDLPAPRAGDDDDDDELLAILGLGPELPAPLPDEPLDLFEPAPPPAAPPAGNDYAKQTVPELKALLKARGLKVGGKKADLVDRLAEADAVPN